jgi:hypothetical protein
MGCKYSQIIGLNKHFAISTNWPDAMELFFCLNLQNEACQLVSYM